MNTEFDKILKEQLSQVNVTPSAGLSKAMGVKLFFQNVKVFHKMKALFLMGTATSIGVFAWYSNARLDTLLNDNRIIVDVNKNNTHSNSLEFVDAPKEVLTTINGNDLFVENVNSLDENTQSTQPDTYKIGASVNDLENIAQQNNKNKETNDAIDIEQKSTYNSKTDESFQAFQKKTSTIVGSEKTFVAEQSTNEEVIEEHLTILAVREADLLSANLLANAPLTVQLPETEMPKTLVKQFSIDAYGSFYGESDIDNSIENDTYNAYNWDFYKESDALAMQSGMGLDINFSVGSNLLRFKMSTGINSSTINDTKAIYKHNEITEPLMLNFLNVDDVSWVNTYGEDSCTLCMYAENTASFEDEMKEEYNRYSYINIPLKVGAEIDFKYASVSAQVGMQYSQLTSAKGIGVTERQLNTREQFYYWKELQVKALQEENKMIRSNYLSFTGSAEARVRLTPKFDLMGGYTFVKSVDGITNDEYIVSKKLKYSQFKAGITYYPFRNKINTKY